jgi:hypothetical protein
MKLFCLLCNVAWSCEVLNRNFKSMELVSIFSYSDVVGSYPLSTSIRLDGSYVAVQPDPNTLKDILIDYPCAKVYAINTDDQNNPDIRLWIDHMCETDKCMMWGDTASTSRKQNKKRYLSITSFIEETKNCTDRQSQLECLSDRRCEFTGKTFGCRDLGKFCGYPTKLSCEARAHCEFNLLKTPKCSNRFIV